MGSTMIKCPYDVEVWGVNKVYRMARRLDKLFITDGRYYPDGTPSWNFDEINKLGIPIISLHRYPEIKKLTRYPYSKIIERFGGMGSEFFTNSICYMVAYAIYKGYKKIRFYGVDMSDKKEYILEKGGVEYWIGRAEGMGITVENTKGSSLCKTPMGIPYGFKLHINYAEIDPYNLLGRKRCKSGCQ